MVRGTAAEVKKLFLDTWPPGVTDTIVTAVLPGVDSMLDGWVRKYYDTELSTTDTTVVHIANLMGKQVVLDGIWSNAGGVLSERLPQPVIFTQEIIMLIDAAISDTTRDGAKTVPMQGDTRI